MEVRKTFDSNISNGLASFAWSIGSRGCCSSQRGCCSRGCCCGATLPLLPWRFYRKKVPISSGVLRTLQNPAALAQSLSDTC